MPSRQTRSDANDVLRCSGWWAVYRSNTELLSILARRRARAQGPPPAPRAARAGGGTHRPRTRGAAGHAADGRANEATTSRNFGIGANSVTRATERVKRMRGIARARDEKHGRRRMRAQGAGRGQDRATATYSPTRRQSYLVHQFGEDERQTWAYRRAPPVRRAWSRVFGPKPAPPRA